MVIFRNYTLQLEPVLQIAHITLKNTQVFRAVIFYSNIWSTTPKVLKTILTMEYTSVMFLLISVFTWNTVEHANTITIPDYPVPFQIIPFTFHTFQTHYIKKWPSNGAQYARIYLEYIEDCVSTPCVLPDGLTIVMFSFKNWIIDLYTFFPPVPNYNWHIISLIEYRTLTLKTLFDFKCWNIAANVQATIIENNKLF